MNFFESDFDKIDPEPLKNYQYTPLSASQKFYLESGKNSHMTPTEYLMETQPSMTERRKEMGIDKLSNAATALNQFAPPGERLAYINPVEEAALKEMGGSGEPAAGGVPSYKKGAVSPTPQRNYSPIFSDNSGNFFRREANPNFKTPLQGSPLQPLAFMFKGLDSGNQPFNYSPVNSYGSSAQVSRYGKAQRYNPSSGIPSFDPDNPQDDALPENKSLKQKAKDLNEFAPKGERLAYINPAEEELLKAFGGSGEPAAGGIPSFKKGDVEAPPPRNYGQETRDTLQAQVDLAPQLFAKEACQTCQKPSTDWH